MDDDCCLQLVSVLDTERNYLHLPCLSLKHRKQKCIKNASTYKLCMRTNLNSLICESLEDSCLQETFFIKISSVNT